MLLRITVQMQQYQAEFHSLPTYFHGHVVNDDPGWLFYPAVVLWRMSPLTMLGLPLTAWVALRRPAPLDRVAARRTTLGLLLFALITILGMSAGAKKIDRYVLPTLPALALLAALGWTAMFAAWLQVDWRRRAALHGAGWPRRGCSRCCFSHGSFTLRHAPYYLTYFNPLLGGTRRAPTVMMVGWGEGLDPVGRWLARKRATVRCVS